MSTSASVILEVLLIFGYLGSPIMLIWGWIRWIRLPKLRSAFPSLSLIGFIFATASAVLAVSTITYALTIHGFGFYDPTLLKIFRLGVLLSLGATVFGVGGVWKTNSLRWHAPVSALGTLVFWIIVASGE